MFTDFFLPLKKNNGKRKNDFRHRNIFEQLSKCNICWHLSFFFSDCLLRGRVKKLSMNFPEIFTGSPVQKDKRHRETLKNVTAAIKVLAAIHNLTFR